MHVVTLVSDFRTGGQSSYVPLGAECTRLTQEQWLRDYTLTPESRDELAERFEFATVAAVTRFLGSMDQWLRPEFELGDTRRNHARELMTVEYRSRAEHSKSRANVRLYVAFGEESDSLEARTAELNTLRILAERFGEANRVRPVGITRPRRVAGSHAPSALDRITELLRQAVGNTSGKRLTEDRTPDRDIRPWTPTEPWRSPNQKRSKAKRKDVIWAGDAIRALANARDGSRVGTLMAESQDYE